MKITIIGAGNVGYQLTKGLTLAGYKIYQVFSRTEERLKDVFPALTKQATTNLQAIKSDADLYIIAVHDDAIQSVAEELVVHHGIVTHTSGATGKAILKAHKNYGIFYPLQTFTRSKPVDFAQIPLCIDGNNKQVIQKLTNIAKQLSQKIYYLDDAQRELIHVTAVIVNNFTNHLFDIAYTILQDNQLDFSILQPLILETAQKVQTKLPSQAQTGPAKRKDKKTLDKHLRLLENYPNYQLLYKLLSKSIME